MKRFLTFIILFISCSFIACSDLTDVAEIHSGYNGELSTPNELALNSTMLGPAFDEASAKGFINSIILRRNGNTRKNSILPLVFNMR